MPRFGQPAEIVKYQISPWVRDRFGVSPDAEGVYRAPDGRSLADLLGPRTYYIRTFGCQMNERDSEILAGQLSEMGLTEASAIEEADLAILNTCAIRGTAEDKVFGEVGRLKAIKDERPEFRIAVCGCMAQEKETIRWFKRHAAHVDIIFGTHNLHRLADLLAQVETDPRDEILVDVWESSEEVVEHLPSRRPEGTKAWVNIIYGCDKYCTYCIVPYTRGRERSRQPEDVLEEVRELAAAGYQEVTLLGQNVNSYGKDLGRDYRLANLLRDVNAVEGIRWIRYLTSHPWDFTPDLIEAIASSEKVCEHFHLPVQAGSDRVLRKMNRHYTRESYLDLVRRVRQAVPGAVLTTDIIVGFPGETEEEFEQTLSLVEEVRFDNAYTFIYSPREGTPAAVWMERDPLTATEKKARLQRLMDLQYRISLERNQALIGQRLEALVEGVSKKNPNVLSARTRGNKLVLLPFEPGLIHRFVTVEICAAHTWTLEGRRVGEPLTPPLSELRRIAAARRQLPVSTATPSSRRSLPVEGRLI